MSERVDRRVHMAGKQLSWDCKAGRGDYRVCRDYTASNSTGACIEVFRGDKLRERNREENWGRQQQEGLEEHIATMGECADDSSQGDLSTI